MSAVTSVATPHATAIRLGILVDAPMQDGWALEAITQALAVPGASLAAVALVAVACDRSAGLDLHARLDRMSEPERVLGDRFFRPVDLVAALGMAPIAIGTVRGTDGWRLDAAGLTALAQCQADAWLCLTAAAPARPFGDVCVRGVLGLVVGRGVPASHPWAGAAEVAASSAVTMIALVDYAQAGDVVRYRSFGATAGTARRNRVRALRKGVGFLRRLVEQWIREVGGEAVAPATLDVPDGYPSLPVPTVGAVGRLWSRVLRSTAAGLVPSLRWSHQWQVAYAFTNGARLPVDRGRLRYLVPPRDRFWADPMAIEHDGRHVVFVEELPYRTQRGHLSAIEVFEDAEPGPATLVLQRPYHLSYPFVFAWNGSLYLLPETAGNKTVELYECEAFPDRWRPHSVLLRGLSAFDATLWQASDRWWMFVNVAEPGADAHDELHLYWASTPLGPWTAHPRNPVVSDVRCARGAGPLFVRDGVLHRPSQDCSIAYGYSVCISRVDVLNEQAYQETIVDRLLPGWRPDVERVHTLAGSARLTVVDCMVRRPKRG
jgi:hypothetical protein